MRNWLESGETGTVTGLVAPDARKCPQDARTGIAGARMPDHVRRGSDARRTGERSARRGARDYHRENAGDSPRKGDLWGYIRHAEGGAPTLQEGSPQRMTDVSTLGLDGVRITCK